MVNWSEADEEELKRAIGEFKEKTNVKTGAEAHGFIKALLGIGGLAALGWAGKKIIRKMKDKGKDKEEAPK